MNDKCLYYFQGQCLMLQHCKAVDRKTNECTIHGTNPPGTSIIRTKPRDSSPDNTHLFLTPMHKRI